MKITSLILWLATVPLAHNAEAIQVMGEQPRGAAPSAAAVGGEREGAIEKIDLGRRIMTVDGTPYIFSATTVTVHGASPLSLRKGDRIQFKVSSESGLERITEIWISPAKRP